MSGGGPEWDALSAALMDITPNCDGDARFTAEGQDVAEVEHLCMLCPLVELCEEYALSARVTAGIWAGRNYNQSSKESK